MPVKPDSIFYQKSSLLRGISESTLAYLLNHATIQEFTRNTTILQQGDEHPFLYLILKGRIKTLRQNEDGDEAVIRLLSAGDTFMDAVIFMEDVSPIAVRTLEDSKLLKIPAHIVRELLKKDPQLSTNLLNIVAGHYKSSMEQVDAMRIKNPTERIGYYLLLRYLEERKRGGAKTAFSLEFNKQDIANQLGVTPETFSRTLKKLRDMGVHLEGNKVKIESPQAFCSFCDLAVSNRCPGKKTTACKKTYQKW